MGCRLISVQWQGVTMAARIGNVLYWIACLLAGCMLALCVYVFFDIEPKDRSAVMFAPFIICAVLFWLAGKALRYIFSGR
jgi:hypothetical protein